MVLEKLQKVANGNGGGTWTQGLGGQELIWTGSPSQLLGVLRTIASEDLKIDVLRSELWPKAPNVLTRRVKQVKSSLRGVGISINKSQNHKTKLRTLEVVKISSISPPLSPGSNPRSDSGEKGGDTGDDTCAKGDDTVKVSSSNNHVNHA